MTIDNLTCILIILLIFGLLWGFGSGVVRLRCGNSSENYNSRNPKSYYDQGDWIYQTGDVEEEF